MLIPSTKQANVWPNKWKPLPSEVDTKLTIVKCQKENKQGSEVWINIEKVI